MTSNKANSSSFAMFDDAPSSSLGFTMGGCVTREKQRRVRKRERCKVVSMDDGVENYKPEIRKMDVLYSVDISPVSLAFL